MQIGACSDLPLARDVTELLIASKEGDQSALDELMPLVYHELKKLAGTHLRRERPGHTLQSTALVHEAYLRLVDQRETNWHNRVHFYAVASKTIRRILVDHVRGRNRARRGFGIPNLSLNEEIGIANQPEVDLEALDEALQALAIIDPQQSRIIELRFFGGLTVDEAASVLRISPATLYREWALARAWLFRRLKGRCVN